MIDSPWQTIWLKQHGTEKIASELAKAKLVNNALQILSEGKVVVVTPFGETVPVFYIPLTQNELGERNLFAPGSVVVDGRSFMKKSAQVKGEYVTNNDSHEAFMLRIAEIMHYWVGSPSNRVDLMRTSDMHAQAFIGWISPEISRKLGLDEDNVRKLQIITAAYYVHLYHKESDVMSDRGKDTVMKLVQRWTRHSFDKVEMVRDLEYMSGLEGFVNEVKRAFPNSTRVSMISTGFLISSLNRGWFGAGAQELLTVALEYPPMWLGLIEAATNSRTYKKTSLGRIAENYSRNNSGNEFSKSLSLLLLQGN